MKKKLDHRFYPQGRKRVYVSPAHMDIHCGDHGFYVEVMNGSYALGFYSKEMGFDTARVVNRKIYDAMKALSQEAAKQYGQSCGNEVCERALEKRMKKE
jgi:hypothetical protein